MPERIGAAVFTFFAGQAWEKGFFHVLRHECAHVSRGLGYGEFSEGGNEGTGLPLAIL